MGKISPVANKYIIHSNIQIDGIVDRPDVIGAIFGQTEGLLGEDLELRELQRSGRIGRIEVNLETNYGKTKGGIIIPSSLDKAETAIVGAALEIIQRIGPCNAKITVNKIEDVRIVKRTYVVNRAKELLKTLMDTAMPDSQELSDEVATSVRVMEIQSWGKEKLSAGPAIDDSDEIIVVEGRADVLTLLKYGFKNAIAMNGSNVPQTIIDLCKEKIVTAFLDGDRGGDLNFQQLIQVTEIDFVTKAPDGKEVEELTKKEIHKALRSKISAEQASMEFSRKHEERRSSPRDNRNNNRNDNNRNDNNNNNRSNTRTSNTNRTDSRDRRPSQRDDRRPQREERKPIVKVVRASTNEKTVFKKMLEDLIGTKGACLLDHKLNILGKVPLSELTSTMKNFSEGVHAIVMDGNIDTEVIKSADVANVKFLVGMDIKSDSKCKVSLLSVNDL